MAYFPLFMDITGRKAVVVGGGKVARRKVSTLLRYGADVHVYSKEISKDVEMLLDEQHLHYRQYQGDASGEGAVGSEILDDATIVIAATGSREVNHQVAKYCNQHRIPVNVIDAPQECSFIFPAVVKKGDISIGINTAAKSPAVASQIRKDIEQMIPDYYEEILDGIGQYRQKIKQTVPNPALRRYLLKEAAKRSFAFKHFLTEEEQEQLMEESKDTFQQ